MLPLTYIMLPLTYIMLPLTYIMLPLTYIMLPLTYIMLHNSSFAKKNSYIVMSSAQDVTNIFVYPCELTAFTILSPSMAAVHTALSFLYKYTFIYNCIHFYFIE